METTPVATKGPLLAQMLGRMMTPVVMVLHTELAEAACRRNGVGLVDLLRPFCEIDQINVPVRTTSEHPHRLQDFRLRLFHSLEIKQMPYEAAEDSLVSFVNGASKDAFSELEGDPAELETIKKMLKAESMSSWFQRYNAAFMQTLAFSEHEAVDHPIACLIIVSSKDDNPVNKFVDLFNTDQLPSLLNDGGMDPKLLKYYVLLHDNQDGPLDRANDILQEIGGTFGVTDCRLLCINSVNSDMASSCGSQNVEPHMSYLSKEDIEEIKDFILELSQKHIIPYMEQKLRAINQQVAATKKGLRNQLKNLWWRKSKDEVLETSSGQGYSFSSMESQMRILADYAFMLHDYELALSNYRLLSTDYKLDKAWKRYAGVQEMMGLSLFMLDANRKEAETCMETAYSTYQRCGAPGARYAVRCALWWSEMLKSREQYREAAIVLFRASSEMDKEAGIRAGVFLEQAAYCYLQCTPPMLRKFGFHLVLASNRYHASGQREHAIRTYMCVSSIYQGQDWSLINDHVQFNLGRLFMSLGRPHIAVQHFIHLLACSHQSATMQTIFLKEFFAAVQEADGNNEMLNLNLPIIRSDCISVQFEDQHTYSSLAAAAISDEEWSILEESVVPPLTTAVSTWLDAPLKSSIGTKKHYNVCVAGEDIGVCVELQNPLQIPIEIGAMSLVCQFEPEGLSDGPFPSQDVLSKHACSENYEQEERALEISEESFLLKGEEKLEAYLKVKPNQPGLLRILGVKWTLCGVATGRHDFVVQKKGKVLKNREEPKIPPRQRLQFLVVARIPRVNASLHEFPDKINAGEVRRVVIELLNPSSVAIKGMKLRTNCPGFLLVGDEGDLDLEFPSCFEKPLDPCWNENRDADDKKLLFCFPEETTLEGNSTLLWPLWLHARHAGNFFLNAVLYYEPMASKSLKYRTVRITHTLQVLPSVSMFISISPSPAKIDELLLRLDVENQHSAESFWLRQVSCVGSGWCLAPLSSKQRTNHEQLSEQQNDVRKAFFSASVSPPQFLPLSHMLSLFFRLVNKTKFLKNHASLEDFGASVRLGPPGSMEPLIDIDSGPLSRFHSWERQLQLPSFEKKVPTKDESFVDIVLISEQQDDNPNANALHNNLHVSTHHVCHCSVRETLPLVWLMDGTSHVVHNFNSDPMCCVTLFLQVRNQSSHSVSVKVETFDSGGGSDKQIAWSKSSEAIPGPTDSISSQEIGKMTRGIPSSTMYIWCGLRSRVIGELKSEACTRIPLQATFFGPGAYDLSSYKLRWQVLSQARELDSTKKDAFKFTPMTPSSSFVVNATNSDIGICPDTLEMPNNTGLGHPFLLTITQV